MTFGQALDRVFKLMKAHIKVFVAIASIPAAVYAAFFAVLTVGLLVVIQPWHKFDSGRSTPHLALELTLFIGLMLIAQFAVLFAYALYEPAASFAALQFDAGVTVTFREAYRRAWADFGRYLWLLILKGLIVSGPIFLLFLAIGCGMALVALHGNGHPDPNIMFLMVPLIVLFYAFAAVYLVLALIWLAFSYPACIAENLTAAQSIARSVRLTKGVRLRIFLLALVIYAISYAAGLVIECVLGLVGGVAFVLGIALHLAVNPWGFIGIGLAAILLFVVCFFYVAISWAGYTAAFAVLYRNQRLCLESAPSAGRPTFSQ